jgi:2-oxo-4-hydroxy-4-carboxy--5-ureidoimidazoline (OHCU) decarboxylase
MFHSHKDHAAEEAIEASKKSQVPHVSDDFEKKLAETEAKIREDLANEPDLNASTASSSSSVSSSSTTMSKSTVRSSMSRMGGYLARHVSKKA